MTFSFLLLFLTEPDNSLVGFFLYSAHSTAWPLRYYATIHMSLSDLAIYCVCMSGFGLFWTIGTNLKIGRMEHPFGPNILSAVFLLF